MTKDIKKLAKISSLSVFFILMLGYTIFVSKDLLFGVKIRNINIKDGTTYTESAQKITGNAKNVIHLALNGREISINQAGDFDETIALLSGYNIVNIRAEDKFGYVDEKNYKLILK